MSKGNEIFSTIPELNHQEIFYETSPEAFENILKNRRSVRVYTTEKVPDQVVEQVLEWGLMAPNSSNLQPWEFYWIKDEVKKAEVVKACLSQPAARTAQEIIVCVARIDQWKERRKEMLNLFKNSENIPSSAKAYYEKLVPLVYSQGPCSLYGFVKKILASVAGIFRPVPREPMSRSDMRIWAVKSTALACQNIMMGFSAFGFDTCPMEGLDSRRIKKILKLGRDAEVVMAISVGKRDKKGIYGPRIRMDKNLFIKKV
jgi:nitroreductase